MPFIKDPNLSASGFRQDNSSKVLILTTEISLCHNELVQILSQQFDQSFPFEPFCLENDFFDINLPDLFGPV